VIYYYFRFLKANGRSIGILSAISIFTFTSSSVRHSAFACLISSESDHPQRNCDVIAIFKMAQSRHSNSAFSFVFCDFAYVERSKSICRPSFGEIPQSTAEILLLPVPEKKRLLYWNFTSGFDFRLCIIIRMSFSIRLPNCVQIGPSATML